MIRTSDLHEYDLPENFQPFEEDDEFTTRGQEGPELLRGSNKFGRVGEFLE